MNEKVQRASDQPRIRFVRLCSASFHEADGIIRDVSERQNSTRGKSPEVSRASLYLVDLITFVAALAKPFADYQKAFRPLSFCERYVNAASKKLPLSSARARARVRERENKGEEIVPSSLLVPFALTRRIY